MTRIGFASLFFFAATNLYAELKPIDDEALSEVVGQSGAVIEMSGQLVYDAIVYTDTAGTKYVIEQGQSSADGVVNGDAQVTLTGQTIGMPQTGTVMDLFSMILPFRMGEVDTDGDGLPDRQASVFSFQPNVGMGTQFMPIDISASDSTTSINDQVFVTKQGLIMLTAPLNGEVDMGSMGTATYNHTSQGVKMF